jgi:hypothetical protein
MALQTGGRCPVVIPHDVVLLRGLGGAAPVAGGLVFVVALFAVSIQQIRAEARNHESELSRF